MKSKEELFSIYEKAKVGKYDLNELEEKEIDILNSLLEEEIRLKVKKVRRRGEWIWN